MVFYFFTRRNFIYCYFFLFIVFIVGIIPINSQSIPEENSNTIQEIEKSWLKELQTLKKEDTPSRKETQQSSENEKEPETQNNPSLFGETPSFFSLVMRFFSTIFVFGIFFYYFIRYLKKKNLIYHQEATPVQILASIPLMSGKFLQIVDIAGQITILGISENNVSLIQVVENSMIAEKIRMWHEEHKKKIDTSQWSLETFLTKIMGNSFSFWHQDLKKKRNFSMELKNKSTDEVQLKDLEELLKAQKLKLKKFTE